MLQATIAMKARCKVVWTTTATKKPLSSELVYMHLAIDTLDRKATYQSQRPHL